MTEAVLPARPRAAVLIWLGLLALCGVVLFTTLQFSYSLTLFLPQPQTDDARVLVERAGEAPGSRFLLVALPGADEEVGQLAREALSGTGAFTRVLAGAPALELGDVPDIVWRYRYLLTDTALNESSLHSALEARAAELAIFAGGDFNTLLRADPTLAALTTLESLATGSTDEPQWSTPDGTAVLVVETADPAFNLTAQARAVSLIRQTLSSELNIADSDIVLSGPGAFGVDLKDTIHAEARNRSIFASLGLAAVLLLAYRRVSVLVLAALPLGTGLVFGLTAVTLVFPAVHGITLAFGFTLLGIAIDYPLHVFSHARSQAPSLAITHLWPTLRLGVASTLIAYLAIAASGAEGPAQLGVFTAAGLLGAALVTRWLLPALMKPAPARVSGSRPLSVTLRWQAPLVVTIAGFALLGGALQGPLWNNDLSVLSPVPADKLAQDQAFRDAVGAPSLRYVIALRSSSLETALSATKALADELPQAVAQHYLQQWQAVTSVLPPSAIQRRRQQALPGPDLLAANLAAALSQTPFAPTIFEPFLSDVQASAALEPLTVDSFADTPLQPFVDSHLYAAGNGDWVSLISLFGDIDAAGLQGWLESRQSSAMLVDFRTASELLVSGYRDSTLQLLLVALAVILAFLLFQLPAARALWSLSVVAAVVIATAGLMFAVFGALNLYHLMALLLVAGLGLDYALFLCRTGDSARSRADTRHAVLACAASTTTAFGILGTSAIPALQFLGTTVATGTLLSLAVAWLGVRTLAPADQASQ